MAVAYIHKKRVLHRDLKTANVFLTSKNLVRLGDFGIARVLEVSLSVHTACVGSRTRRILDCIAVAVLPLVAVRLAWQVKSLACSG